MNKFLRKQKGNAIAFLMIAAALGLALFLSGYWPTHTVSTGTTAQIGQQAPSTASVHDIRTEAVKPLKTGTAQIAKPAETAATQPEKSEEINLAKPAKPSKLKKSLKREKMKSSLSAARTGETRLAEEVYDLTQGFTSAFEGGNLDVFLSFFSKSATENNILSYDGISEEYGDLFEKRLYRFHYSIGNAVIREKEKRIIVNGSFVMNGHAGDGTDRTKKGTLTMALKRENGKLKITHLQKKFD